MSETKTSGEQFDKGRRLRKKLSWDGLGHWDAQRRAREPLDLLRQSDTGRLTRLLRLKHERMSASTFGFFRGAAALMAYDLSLSADTGVLTQLCGDAHVQNLGAYTGVDGRLVFDINDFDETICGPFEWDVKRMATSILLAGAQAEIKKSEAKAAVMTFLSAYSELMLQLSSLPVLEAARFQVHRLANVAPISKVLQKAERATPQRSLESLTEEKGKRRQFTSRPPLLRRITGAERAAVLASLVTYTKSLLPERGHFFAQYKALDVAIKIVGTGSVGLRDYCVYMEGNGPDDPLFLQVKQEAASAYAGYVSRSASRVHENQGERVAAGQRAMQLQSDPLLGWSRFGGEDYLVRQLNDHKAAIDVATLSAADLSAYGSVCGELLARGHARAGDPRLIAGYLGGGKRFSAAILEYAAAYAAQTVQDWKAFLRAQKAS